MDISRIFVKTKQFLFRNRFLLVVSTFITAPISIIASIAFYAMADKAYSFRSLLFAAFIVFAFLVWFVWFLLKIVLSQAVINTIKKSWKGSLILCFTLLQFLNITGWYSQYLNFIKQPNVKYQVEIMPAEDSSGSICIREVKNNLGKINWDNNSIFDLEITGEWKNNTNNCQFFIGETQTGSIKFKNTGPLNDVLAFILGAYPGAGQLLIRTNTSPEELFDLHYAIQDDQIKIVKLSPNSLAYNQRPPAVETSRLFVV